MKRKRLSWLAAITLVMALPNLSFGQTPTKPAIVINAEPLQLEQESFIDELGVLMVPMRGVLEQLGYTIEWDSKDKSITLLKSGQEIPFQTDHKAPPPVLKNGTTYVSAQYLSKFLHNILSWNSQSQVLSIRNIKDQANPLLKLGSDTDIQSQLNAYMEALVANENFHGSVLLAKDGHVLLNSGYGYADFAQKIKNKSQTRFSIGSVTKQFTAEAILRLSDQGLLDIQGKVANYLPDFPHGDQITIHHLLTHTSGLVNYTDLGAFAVVDQTNKDPRKVLALVQDLDLAFTPGLSFQYSNTNYLLLGIIIEEITGHSFSAYLETITGPLGMDNTGIIGGHRGGANDATPYVGFLDLVEIDDHLVLSQAYAAGSMYSTVEDLYLWDRLGKSEALLKKQVTVSTGVSYGYGWMIEETDFGTEISHGGNTLGSTAYIGNLVEEDITVIILSNNAGYDTTRLKNDLLAITLGKEYEMPKALKEIEIKDKNLYNNYTGKYMFMNGTYLTITHDQGKLYAQVTGQGAFEIFPYTPSDFFAKVLQVNIEFIPDETGRSKALKFSQAGMAFIWDRVEAHDEKKEVKVDAQILGDYVGDYEFQEGFFIKITTENGRLYAQLTGQDRFEIFPSSETSFFYKVVDAQINFEKDEDGLVTGLVLYQMGVEIEAAK